MAFPPFRVLTISLALFSTILAGCATTGPGADPTDPYTGYNHAVFKFNDNFYHFVATPVTNVYEGVTPEFVRTGIGNAFNNVDTVPAIVNDALQFNWRYLIKDTTRLVLNTTLGLFGLIDVAGASGIPAHQQGFSYTLAKWGYVNSSYFMLPFIGPGTVSSALSLPVNYLMSPLSYATTGDWKPALWTMQGVQNLYEGLPPYNTITKTAIDPYLAVRNAYIQNRAFVIQQINHDGVLTGVENPNDGMSPVLLTDLSNS